MNSLIYFPDDKKRDEPKNNELTVVQTKALLFAAKKAKLCHNNCIYLLRKRILDKNLHSDVYDKLLRYMQNEVPLITHFNANILTRIGESNYLKNAFETHSKGSSYLVSREKWEANLFNSLYDKTDAFDRPKYCSLNLIKNPKGGTNSLRSYGKSFMVYKNHIRYRTTFVFDDTCRMDHHNATLSYCSHILCYISDKVFDEIVRIVLGEIENSSIDYSPYIDCQIHGPVDIDHDIESIHIDESEKQSPEIIDEFIKLHPNINIQLL